MFKSCVGGNHVGALEGKFCSSDVERVPFAEQLLLHAAGMLQGPKETAVLADILVALRGVEA